MAMSQPSKPKLPDPDSQPDQAADPAKTQQKPDERKEGGPDFERVGHDRSKKQDLLEDAAEERRGD